MGHRTTNRDVIRLKLATIHVLLLEERKDLAELARKIETGSLNEEQAKWQQESLLHEMFLFEMSAQIVEAMIKTLI